MTSNKLSEFSINSPSNSQKGSGFTVFDNLFSSKKTVQQSQPNNTTTSLIYKLLAQNDSTTLNKVISNLEPQDLNEIDFNMVNKNGNGMNILHLLSISKDYKNSLKKILENTVVDNKNNLKNALNEVDNDGKKPTFYMLNNGYNDLIDLSRNKGADTSQVAPNVGIHTDYDTEQHVTTPVNNKNVTTPVNNKNVTQKATDFVNSVIGKTKDYVKTINNAQPLKSDDSIFNKASNKEPTADNDSMSGGYMSESLKNILKQFNSVKNTADTANDDGDEYNSQQILDMLTNATHQQGGKKQLKKSEASGRRHVNTNSEVIYYGGKKDHMDSDRLSRSVDNKSTQLHEASLEKINKLVAELEPKLSKEQRDLRSRAYKGILYAQVKAANPNMSNLEKAQELEKQVTEDNIKKIKKNNIAKVEEIEQHISNKPQRSESDNTPKNSETDKKKEKKTKPEKKTSRSKKNKKGGSSEMYTEIPSDSDTENNVPEDMMLSVVKL